MSYVDSNLMTGESVVYRAKTHWFLFIFPIIILGIGASLAISGDTSFGNIVLLVGGIMLIRAFMEYISTEFAVTTKRIIAKKGLIRRSTVELNHSKVEALNVNQGVFGRIFGYGTVTVNGAAQSTGIPHIASPMEFRKQAHETIDNTQSGDLKETHKEQVSSKSKESLEAMD